MIIIFDYFEMAIEYVYQTIRQLIVFAMQVS